MATSPSSLFASPLAAELAEDVLERFLRYVRIDTQSAHGVDDLALDREAARPLAAAVRRAGGDRARRRAPGGERLRLRRRSPGRTTAPVDRADRARRHLSGRDRNERAADRPPRLRRQRARAARRPRRRPRPRRAAPPDRQDRTRPRHHRRDDPARRRRQGRRRRDRGRGRVPEARTRSRRTRRSASASRPTRRSRAAPSTSIWSASAPATPTRSTGRSRARSRPRRSTRRRSSSRSAAARPIPGTAKGQLVNAIKLAADLVAALPRDSRSPETTEEREGFVHPTRSRAAPSRRRVELIVRDHDAGLMQEHVALIERLAAGCASSEPRARDRRRGGGAVPEHGRGDRALPRGDRSRRGGGAPGRARAAALDHPRRHRRRAALRTAGCRRRTSSPAAPSTTLAASGRASRTWPPPRRRSSSSSGSGRSAARFRKA